MRFLNALSALRSSSSVAGIAGSSRLSDEPHHARGHDGEQFFLGNSRGPGPNFRTGFVPCVRAGGIGGTGARAATSPGAIRLVAPTPRAAAVLGLTYRFALQ